MAKKYKVLKDTREQLGWQFEKYKRGNFDCLGTEVATLKTGDYTIEEYQDCLCIERKGSVGEFAGNLFEKRFFKELERMDSFKYSFLILEFNFWDIINFPYSSNIPKSRWKKLKMTPHLFVKKLNEIMLLYKTKIVFVGNEGKKFVSSLFKRILENEPR